MATVPVSTSSSEPLLHVRDLSKIFVHGGRELAVLREINLTVQPGEMLAIVGKSGAGKSTLLHIVGTIDHPTSGTIHFLGENLRRLDDTRLAAFRNKSIGFVFQFHHLLPEFSALENVKMPCLIQRMPWREAEDRAREILVAVGLEHRVTHRPGELSGGEQQRVALARALVMRPRLLLADEPTGNLDSKTSDAIHDLFFSLNDKYGSSMLIVTHNNDLAARLPRRVTMVDGTLEESGNPYRTTGVGKGGN